MLDCTGVKFYLFSLMSFLYDHQSLQLFGLVCVDITFFDAIVVI